MVRYLPYLAALALAAGCQSQVAGQGSAATILPSDTSALLRPVGESAPTSLRVARNDADPALEQPSQLIVSER